MLIGATAGKPSLFFGRDRRLAVLAAEHAYQTPNLHVRLDLDLRRDIPDNAGNNVTAVAQRNIKTQVVVDSGTALVVGGIYVVSDTDSEKGIPFFRKLPLIGTLFSATKKSVFFWRGSKREELSGTKVMV